MAEHDGEMLFRLYSANGGLMRAISELEYAIVALRCERSPEVLWKRLEGVIPRLTEQLAVGLGRAPPELARIPPYPDPQRQQGPLQYPRSKYDPPVPGYQAPKWVAYEPLTDVPLTPQNDDEVGFGPREPVGEEKP
jgi:hypothetical protein